MNGAMLYSSTMSRSGSNSGFGIQYVEGLALDEFAAGRIILSPKTKRANKIGLLLDKGIEPDLRARHIQVVLLYH